MSELAELLGAPGASVQAENDFENINKLCRDRGWGDGPPIVPPTVQRVE